MLIVLFLVSHFNFLFVPCGGLSWLPVSFLLHVKYTLSYRIVSYRIVLFIFTLKHRIEKVQKSDTKFIIPLKKYSYKDRLIYQH